MLFNNGTGDTMNRPYALILVLVTCFASIAGAVELRNWRLPYYTIASEMGLASSSPSGMFWDDIGAAPIFNPVLWPQTDDASQFRWTIEPCASFGIQAPHEDDSLTTYGRLELLSDIRYRNILVRQTLDADRRYDNDPFYPAHRDRFARGRIEEAYMQIDWHYGFIRFGRLLRNWGPFADRSLLLSYNPYSYDGFEWQVHSSVFEFRQMFAAFATNSHFPDSADNTPGRFFAAHALNVMFGKWATLGVIETYVFQRQSGFPDFQYLNPFSLYSVLDLNQEGGGNLMLGFQWKVQPFVENVSLKGQLLLDDIQVDKKVVTDREPTHWGIDAGVYWRDGLPLPMRHLLKAGYQRCSRWAYTVEDQEMDKGEGYTYLSKGLGFPENDGDNLYAALSLIGRNFWTATGTIAYGRQGQNTVTSRWYDSDPGNIIGLPVDSPDIIQRTMSLSLEAMAYYKNYADIRIGLANRWIKNNNHLVSAGFIYSPLFTSVISVHFSSRFFRQPKQPCTN
ncbi:MAG: hypothetical protein ABSF80_00440 [Chitinispirillaceae bacterium]|jgi:hypothetical protein